MSSILAEDITHPATLRLPENCTGRLCYAQRTAATGERAYGHFFVEAPVLAEALWRQIDSPLLNEPGDEELALYRWLNNPERVDDQPEMLPAEAGELGRTIGLLFSEGRARAFCLCCNRNVRAQEVRRAPTGPFRATPTARYLCSEGHLLLGLEEAAPFSTANRHAA